MWGTYARSFAYQNHINEDGENRQQTHCFHCDQIGIPREMTDIRGIIMRIQKGWYWLIIMTIEEIMVYITHKEKAEEVYGEVVDQVGEEN